MGKNNKGAKAPQKPAPAPVNNTQTSIEKPIEVIDVHNLNKGANLIAKNNAAGLDPNHRVDLLKMLHETYRLDPNAAEKYHMDQKSVDNINAVTAHGMVAALACEVVYAENQFAITMKRSQLDEIMAIGSSMGINIDQKMLPNIPENEEEVIEVSSEAVKIDKDVKKQIEEEKKIIETPNVNLDPTKMKNNEDIKTALVYILANRSNNWTKIDEAVKLMRSYLLINAKDDAEKETINAISTSEIIAKIEEVVERCPFVLNSFGRSMRTFTASTKSPISAFCMLRESTKNKETGIPAISDEEIAEYVKAIITWSIDLSLSEYNAKLAESEKELKDLKKDAKKNASAIEAVEAKITSLNNNIAHANDTISLITMPTGDVADNLLENLVNGDQSSKQIAKNIFGIICKTYYDDIDLNTCKPESVKHNVQQYAGVITNFFRPANTPLAEYSVANITSLEPITTEEPTKTEEESSKK